MPHVDIVSYLAQCRSVAAEELERLLTADSILKPALQRLMVDLAPTSTAGLCAALCLSTSRALGGMDDCVLPIAAVMELYHQAFEAQSQVTLEGLAAETTSGQSLAEAAGHATNALLAMTLEPLLEKHRAFDLGVTVKMLETVARMARETAEGCLLEASWLRAGAWALSDADYRGMVLKKWVWHEFVAPIKVGALAAGATGEQGAQLEQFAVDLGFAFRLHEDVSKLSRSGFNDSEGLHAEHSLPLLHALRAAPAETKVHMERALARMRWPPVARQTKGLQARRQPATSPDAARPAKTERDSAFLAQCIHDAGGADYARDLGHGYALRARAVLERARTWLPPSEHGHLLHALTDFTRTRVF